MEHHIDIVEYDPAWPDAYGRVAARVGRALGDRLARVEHVGSTAVPGLASKPVVDVRAMVDAGADLAACVDRLEADTRFEYVFDMRHWKTLRREVSEVPPGERFPEDAAGRGASGEPSVAAAPEDSEARSASGGRPEADDDAGRRPARLRSNAREDGDAVRAYNLHLTTVDGEEWPKNVAFRDYLREHADAREEYEAAKRAAAREHPDDVEAYSEAKGDAVTAILDRAREAGYLERVRAGSPDG